MVGNLLAFLLGQGIEQLGESARLKWWRIPLYVVTLALAIYFIIATLFLWQSPDHVGTVGLVQFSTTTGMAWTLLAPTLAGVTAVLLVLPVAGRMVFVLLGALAACGIGLAALITFQGHAAGITDAATNVSQIAAFALVIFALALAINDHPALTSPLARLALPYAMRLNHLRALQQFGQEQGWAITGPAGGQNTLLLDGPFGRNHRLFITSAMRLTLSQGNTTDGAVLSVAIRSQADIPGFYSGPTRLEQGKREGLMELEIAIPGKPPLYTYIQPSPELPLTPAVAEQIAALIRMRPDVLPADAIVQATPLGMRVRYTRFYRRLTAKDGRPEKILQWLDQLVTTLEAISPPLTEQDLTLRWQMYQPKL